MQALFLSHAIWVTKKQIMNNSKNALNIAFGVMLGALIVGSFAFGEGRLQGPKEHPQRIAPTIPTTLSFAGEKVPLERWDVKERLDRELLFNYYNEANVLFLMKLANKYFPVIEERLAKAGVPDDFKYLCVAESNLLAGAKSAVGATGFWQFMNGTAPGYGLKINSEVDFRQDLEKSTDAACAYLKNAYAKFGSWTAAAASYNCGVGGYNGQATYQGTTHYYDLLLPEETNRYIFRILAFKQLLEHAGDYGFNLNADEKYTLPETRSVTVSTTIPNLAQWAAANGTNYKMLRLLNPWLRGRSLTVAPGSSYNLKLPR